MGEVKPLVPWKRGDEEARLIDGVTAPLWGRLSDILVITGYKGEEVENYLRRRYPEESRPGGILAWSRNSRYQEGMLSSLVRGFRGIKEPWIFVVPADMPSIEGAVYEALWKARNPRAILFPAHRGQRGHPVLFPRPLITELLIHLGGRPKGESLKQHLGTFPSQEVEVESPGIFDDRDTPESLH